MKRLVTSWIIILSTILFFADCQGKNEEKEVKYLFYFIGDGMGLAHRTLTEMYLASLNETIGQQRLLMDSLPVQGIATTYSLNSYITCSAASGTALATGNKTKNGMISCSPDSIPYRTIAEMAKTSGRSVGILTNVTLNHATPAVFSAHEPSRSRYKQIREDQLKTGFDFFAGGYMAVEESVTPADKQSFYQQAADAGYTIIDTQEELENIVSSKKYIVFADTTEKGGEMFFNIDRPQNSMTLLQMFNSAVGYLSENPKGFFMMLESGKIDWAAHSNDAATVIGEITAFDEIIREAFRFYQKHPTETLIVITSDHETGGLSLGNNEMRYVMKPALLQHQKASAEMIKSGYPAFIADVLNNRQKNVETAYQFVELWFGLGTPQMPLKGIDSTNIAEAWQKDLDKQGDASYLVTTAKKMLAQKAGIGWGTSHHTGSPVPVSAVGAGAENFNGYYDNTDIPKKIIKMMKIKE